MTGLRRLSAAAAAGGLAVAGIIAAAPAAPAATAAPVMPAPAVTASAASSVAASSALPTASRAGARPAAPAPPTAAGDASYTAANLPGWAIGPFTPAAASPVLSPGGSGYEAAALYNPGVLYRAGKYQMLFRAQATPGGPSQIGYASSSDGIHFTQDTADNPVISFGLAGQQDACGLEDPRLYELGGTYYSFFTSVHPKADGSCYGSYDISESTSTDAVHWSVPRVVEPNAGSNKDAAVVTSPDDTPVKINGQYVMYFGQGGTGADIAYSGDMLTWHARGSTTAGTADTISLHYPSGMQPYEVCVAVTGYQTVAGGPVNHNIVLFTAGTLMADSRWFYAVSEEEFSRQQPTQLLHQLSDAVLTPTPDVPYEWNGQTPKTVWTNSIGFHDGTWRMYFGGGDTVTGLATAPLRSRARGRAGKAATAFQTGFEHGQPMPDWIDSADTSPGGGGVANVTAYPSASGLEASVRQEKNHDGTSALMYSGQAAGAADDHAYMKVADLSGRPVTVTKDTTLSYWIYPQASGSDAPGVSGGNSTCVALDLVFAGGSALHGLRGSPLTPASQCGVLQPGQWNQVSADIGAVAAGRKIVRIDVGYDQPGSSGGYRGYIDDIAVTAARPRPAVITGVTPGQTAPGQRVTITGTGFGATRHNAHLLVSDAGVSWGGPGDLGTLTVSHWSDTSITFTMPRPSGPAVSTSSGPVNLWRTEPGTTATVAVVTGAAAVSNAGQVGVADTTTLADYFDDVGISPDASPGCGAYDDGTDTYSAAALATATPASLTPGATVNAGGLTFTWPDSQPCSDDNVRALGQTIALPPRAGATRIGFLGAATNGSTSGVVTVHYTDGSSAAVTLAQTDWGSAPGSGSTGVAMMAYRNQATGQQLHAFYVDEQNISVDPARTVASLTLPDNKNVHIFAISQDGTPAPGG